MLPDLPLSITTVPTDTRKSRPYEDSVGDDGFIRYKYRLSLCKIHHAAFDRNILGIRPDLIVEIRDDILEEEDEQMLPHGLQDLHGRELVVVPRARELKPDPARLEERYEPFRQTG